jgi:hypothetical protein
MSSAAKGTKSGRIPTWLLVAAGAWVLEVDRTGLYDVGRRVWWGRGREGKNAGTLFMSSRHQPHTRPQSESSRSDGTQHLQTLFRIAA